MTFCVLKQEYQTEFPQQIKSTYFQQDSDTDNASGIHFYIEFKEPLSTTIKLNKAYFRNQESVVRKISNTIFVAHFKQRIKSEDLILDSNPLKEYGNKAPVIVRSKFDLKADEVLLEYRKNGEMLCFKISNTKVKPM